MKREIEKYAHRAGSSGLPYLNEKEHGERQTVTLHDPRPAEWPFFNRLPYSAKSKRAPCTCTAGSYYEKNGKVKSNFFERRRRPRMSEGYHDLDGRNSSDIANMLDIRGPLYVYARGKELVLAIGKLEGHSFWLPTATYNEIVSQPVVNRGSSSHAFPLGPQFYADNRKEGSNISIQAAFIRPDWTLVFCDHNVMISFHIMELQHVSSHTTLSPASEIWPFLWSSSHGPTVVEEKSYFEDVVNAWKAWILKASERPKQRYQSMIPIYLVLKDKQQIFNGYGAQEACDFLFKAMLPPHLPCAILCKSDVLWNRFTTHLFNFQSDQLSQLKEAHLPSVSGPSPFYMNKDGHGRFLTHFVHCYRRRRVRVDGTFLQEVERLGYLNLSRPALDDDGYATDMFIIFFFVINSFLFLFTRGRKSAPCQGLKPHYQGANSVFAEF
ncbi:hypothetical protein CVT24_012655 [Panaeolus cyanescens]|uniref:Uncharacterized protein n=1 Tax=Panaeolus cyanescens TaxID=181874 RepID=A0A409WKF6_9AGAR|nr:hypothetical protein CVT24_012655 [Panaeolus cyanescens]